MRAGNRPDTEVSLCLLVSHVGAYNETAMRNNANLTCHEEFEGEAGFRGIKLARLGLRHQVFQSLR